VEEPDMRGASNKNSSYLFSVYPEQAPW
jgi:hypothetical protein